MRKANWGTCVLGIALLVVGGCTIPDYFNLNFFQASNSSNDRVIFGSLESVSASTKDGLEKLGMSVKADKQGEDVRLAVRAKSGESFAVVLTRVQSDRGEQTRVRLESGTADHQQIVFNLLSQLELQKSR
jgi:hypothetical protein